MKPGEDTTVIGKSVTIRGELSASEDIFLDGELQGTVTLQGSRLTIGPNGRVLADITVRDAVIYGRVEGNIRATGRIELRQTAIVKGDLTTNRLSIEESATIQGRVEISSATAGESSSATSPSTHAQVAVEASGEPVASLFGEQKV